MCRIVAGLEVALLLSRVLECSLLRCVQVSANQPGNAYRDMAFNISTCLLLQNLCTATPGLEINKQSRKYLQRCIEN